MVKEFAGALALIEATDDDFAWMLDGTTESARGLRVPGGGVDTPDVLRHVQAMARSSHAAQGHADHWMIVVAGEVVGLIGYKALPADGTVEIGYSVAARRRRQGHATAAVAALIASARSDDRVTTILANTAVANHASQAVLRKNGFRCAGLGIDPDDGDSIVRWRLDF
jgi:RimJ/RimL family protein N-acetyltransferase